MCLSVFGCVLNLFKWGLSVFECVWMCLGMFGWGLNVFGVCLGVFGCV